jgi:hypothetical protein
MSALTDRDTNAQPTSDPSGEAKQTFEGEENKAQESAQNTVEDKLREETA